LPRNYANDCYELTITIDLVFKTITILVIQSFVFEVALQW
jgi:hypothetical protein